LDEPPLIISGGREGQASTGTDGLLYESIGSSRVVLHVLLTAKQGKSKVFVLHLQIGFLYRSTPHAV
jgi:hypothetical protein